ncbi:MAG: leucine-rich repeat protein [Acholeplasmatales bacterium]|jgi:uncharacterized repeat protein (TIGR02543 family)|nr:leucine-rich repeat protein [Acholeplasmatales bacterium]
MKENFKKRNKIMILVASLLLIVLSIAFYSCSAFQKEYLVTFNTNGGNEMPSVVIEKGALVSSPSKPTKSLNEFVGWYTDKKLTAVFDFSVQIKKNTTLYAKWKYVGAEVNLDLGNGNIEKKLFSVGTKEYNSYIPLRSGFTFDGWYKSLSSTSLYNEDIVPNVTLYAKWITGEYIYTINNNKITIESFVSNNETDIVIPSTIIGMDVVVLQKQAFLNCTALKTVVIPFYGSSIKEAAFGGCPNVTIFASEVAAPDSWSSNWNSLKRPVYWNFKEFGVNNDYDYFITNDNKANILKYKGSQAVLTISTIDNHEVKFIESLAFLNCVSLTSLTIAPSVETINIGAFQGCSSLVSITIPFTGNSRSSTKELGLFGYIFGSTSYSGGDMTTQDYDNTDKSVHYYIPSSLKTVKITAANNIPFGAFSGCTKLTSIELSSTVFTINSYAFYNCSSLTSFTIPYSVTTIEFAIFNSCSSLVEITIPFVGKSNTSSDGSALFGYIFGTSKYNGGIAVQQYYGSYSSYTNYLPANLKKVTVTNTNTVPYGAFYNCSSLTSIVLPSTITVIDKKAFYNCSSLASFTIPASVTIIDNYAFSNCSSVKTFIIPSKVITIGENAFEKCVSITSITVPSTVTTISYAAFSGCSGLVSITLPFVGKTTSSSDSAGLFGYIFGNSSNSGGTVVQQNYYQFGYTNNWFPNSLRTVNITGGTTIPYGAFYNCSNITSITIPSTITSIETKSFYNCSALTSITIPSKVTTIGNEAFRYCSSLGNVVIPSSVTTIGADAFNSCTNIKLFLEKNSIPSGWSTSWNSSNRPVYYSNQWHYDSNGKPVLN